MVREVAEGLSCACALVLIDDDEHFTTSHVHASNEDILRAFREQFVSKGPQRIDAHPGLKHVVATGTPFFAKRVDERTLANAAPEVERAARQTRATSALVVPLMEQQRVVGALSLTRHGDDTPALDDDDLALAQILAEHAGVALTTARLFEQLDRELVDRFEADRTRALLAAIVESSNDAIVSKRLDGTITSWNSAAERLFGYTASEAIGQSVTMLFPPERLGEERELLARISAGESVAHYETVRRDKSGTDVAVSISLSPVRDTAGNIIGASKTVRDLSAARKAKEALARTEEQLRQAQKMDAVGRLAGGVAHDFNNLLSVILSLGDLMYEDMKPSDPARGDLEEIRKAAVRAAELTRQLLLFSRQQVVTPQVLSLDDVVASMDRFLTRIVGEDVDFVSTREPTLGRVRADPGSVEQLIMNLVVNARDAMPTGGKLTIETKNVELDADYARDHFGVTPGPHVMLAVSDTDPAWTPRHSRAFSSRSSRRRKQAKARGSDCRSCSESRDSAAEAFGCTASPARAALSKFIFRASRSRVTSDIGPRPSRRRCNTVRRRSCSSKIKSKFAPSRAAF